DEWQKFANLRLVYSYMFTHPGTKLLFMGGEFGQGTEWDFSKSLDWYVLEYPNHKGIQETVKALNKLYRSEPALYEKAFEGSGFEWIDGGNSNDSILIYTRKGHDKKDDLVIVLNMTPTPHQGYRVGVPEAGNWKEIFNSDNKHYWGGGMDNPKAIKSEKVHWHGKENSIAVTLPPLGATVFKMGK
ncbi:MAG: alpha amylase C-terminal domain-containing protein, partial [Bacteroidetes bacterium]|nr:alpha amylase C-terminal domain-containing protein [Bacteroidota bacterium]